MKKYNFISAEDWEKFVADYMSARGDGKTVRSSWEQAKGAAVMAGRAFPNFSAMTNRLSRQRVAERKADTAIAPSITEPHPDGQTDGKTPAEERATPGALCKPDCEGCESEGTYAACMKFEGQECAGHCPGNRTPEDIAVREKRMMAVIRLYRWRRESDVDAVADLLFPDLDKD